MNPRFLLRPDNISRKRLRLDTCEHAPVRVINRLEKACGLFAIRNQGPRIATVLGANRRHLTFDHGYLQIALLVVVIAIPALTLDAREPSPNRIVLAIARPGWKVRGQAAYRPQTAGARAQGTPDRDEPANARAGGRTARMVASVLRGHYAYYGLPNN